MSSPPSKPAELTIADIEQYAGNFADRHLTEYVDDIASRHRQFSRKEVNDPLWGTINLAPIEVALLDSPLIQRLRGIRQLGVVHWIYPGAGHTRFEHTIGVLRQVQNLVTALNVLGLQYNEQQLINQDFTQLLRLCALVHDTGHAAFSHVSELALETLPGINTLAVHFSQKFKVEDRQLSEIFAFYIIRSAPFRRFLSTMLDIESNFISFSRDRNENLDLIVEKMSDAVIGKKIDDRIPLLHEVISGPFDADKLDYFVRDAHQAGTPSLLDISRLIQKISVRPLSKHDLPDPIKKNVQEITGSYWLFGIRWSGVAVLDELHLARVLLYAKIYRHPKVIAVEQMLQAALISLAAVASPMTLIKFVYEFDDDQLLGITSERILAGLAIDPSQLGEEGKTRVECAAKILCDLKFRRLSVKAFQIQHRYPFDPLEKDQTQEEGMIDFGKDVSHPQDVDKFKKKLVGQVFELQTLLSTSKPLSLVELDTVLNLRMVGQTPGATQIARAYLLPTTDRPMPSRTYTVNRAAWAASYMSDQPSGYIFAPDGLADLVYIAVERLLRTEFGVRLPESALEASKRASKKIQNLKKALAEKGFYRDAPFDIRPVPERLRNLDVDSVIDDFAKKAAIYQEPQDAQFPASVLELRDKARHWLRQFDNNDHIECALTLLKHFKFITRQDTVSAVRTFIENNNSFQGATVIPFGAVRDSGSIQTYFTADLMPTYVSGCETLDAAAKKSIRGPIIIIDDFVASGGQGRDILAAGFGLSSLRQELSETRDMFEGDVQTFLRSNPVAFVFTAGWKEGIDSIVRLARQAGMKAVAYCHLLEDQLPFAFENCLNDVDSSVMLAFKERCREIGEGLIASMQTAPDKSKIQSRALGYGNRGMLLASSVNVPSQTLTCFWANGTVDSVDWQPLLLRRKKL